MSQVSYGTITINDLTDITDVYLEYALVSDTITRAEDIPSSTQWSTTYPTWVSGQQIWIRRVTRKEGIDIPEYGTPYLDKAVNQIQNNYIGLSNKLRTFFYPGDSTYSGAFAVSKTSTDGLNTANANTYGFNTRVASALISMGYNKIPLLEMGLLGSNFNGIKLYSPVLTNNVITGNRLDATLTSEGLKLLKGGIEAGTFNSNDYIYVWSNDDNNHAIKIGNSSNNKNDWRIIAGNKFGVDKAGNLYANNADITGAITATSLTIGSGANSYDGAAAINISGYSIEIELSNTGVSDTTSQVYLIPHLYHNGIEDTTNVVYTRYMWYRNDESIGTVGSSVDGGILAYRNSVYRVNYQFDDGEVGSGTPVQTIEVNPTKYITDINDSGIKVHAQDWDDDSNYLQIDGNGIYIKDLNDNSVAEFGVDGIQIGKNNNSHIEIDYHSLQLQDKESDSYFWVSDLRDQNGYAEIKETFYVKKTINDVAVSFPINSPENYNPIITNGIDTYEYTYTEGNNFFHIITPRSYDNFITFTYKTRSNLAKAYTFGVRDSFSSDRIGGYSFVEGYNCNAGGAYSHAEGLNTIANGKSSHTQNESTIANYDYQTVIGKYNDNQEASAFEIGNGSNLGYSNALAVNWNGNITIAGTLTQSSDKRLKEHKSYLSTDAIKFIQNLKPAHFIKDNQSHVGFYAQDIEKIDEWNCMIGEMNGYKTLGYTEIIAPLVAYCQHLEERIKQLENQ